MGAVAKTIPICIYDLAERLRVEVKFARGNSLGGMYAKASETILVPTMRPPGRQAFSCAHELGHWFFGHGSRVDELKDIDPEDADDVPEEKLANLFAGFLLMPSWAIAVALKARSWTPLTLTPLQVYTIASQFGVGYETLVQHLRWSLDVISASKARDLIRTTPKEIRGSLLPTGITARHLLVVDSSWTGVPIDLRIGDIAILPPDVRIEGRSIRLLSTDHRGVVVEGQRTGISRAERNAGTWASFIRVCAKEFHGRAIYRFLEDPDVD